MSETSSPSRYPIDRHADRILAAALLEFARAGFAGARLSAIARRAGLSPTTVGLYFTSKEELFREAVRSAVVRAAGGTAQASIGPDPDRGAIERLRAFADHFWRAMEAPEQEALLRLSIGELAGFPDLALLHSSVVLGRALAQVEGILRDGIAGDELRVVNPRAMARIIVSTMILHALWLSAPGVYGGITGPDREPVEAGVLDALTRLLRGP